MSLSRYSSNFRTSLTFFSSLLPFAWLIHAQTARDIRFAFSDLAPTFIVQRQPSLEVLVPRFVQVRRYTPMDPIESTTPVVMEYHAIFGKLVPNIGSGRLFGFYVYLVRRESGVLGLPSVSFLYL